MIHLIRKFTNLEIFGILNISYKWAVVCFILRTLVFKLTDSSNI